MFRRGRGRTPGINTSCGIRGLGHPGPLGGRWQRGLCLLRGKTWDPAQSHASDALWCVSVAARRGWAAGGSTTHADRRPGSGAFTTCCVKGGPGGVQITKGGMLSDKELGQEMVAGLVVEIEAFRLAHAAEPHGRRSAQRTTRLWRRHLGGQSMMQKGPADVVRRRALPIARFNWKKPTKCRFVTYLGRVGS